MHSDVTAVKRDPALRRSFFIRAAAIVTGALAGLFPFAVGFGVVTNPLRRSRSATGGGEPSDTLVPICPLEALPADGIPRPFAVTTDVSDAWTHAPAQRIGAVFLSRSSTDPNTVTAFSATCPHLGCAVEFDAANSRFECPCHKSGFAKDGEKLFGPSHRGLDPLKVELQDKGGTKEVLVRYARFQAGIAERKPIG
jgi:menaquinol-cytochrome c reductase iron-sulfur subunit